jgi:aerobic carbon-monoxide dehydrogenase large subunit
MTADASTDRYGTGTVHDVSSGVGARQLRLEDQALLTGTDLFTSDLHVPGCLHAVYVRSPMAHATIAAIDTDEAAWAPGVVAVFTADDLEVAQVFMPNFGKLLPDVVHRRPLAGSTVRFVGDIVAVVVAETLVEAEDAAELVHVDYEPLPAVVDIDTALAEGAPLLFPELGSNLVMAMPYESGTRVDSPVRVECRTTNPRMAAAPMEGLAAVAEPGDGGALKLTVSTQMPHVLRDLSASILGMDPEQLHVVSPAVGGGFGGKTPAEPDYVLLAAIARYLGEPVAWTQTRTENLLTMQARGHIFDVVLEATDDGVVTSLQVRATSDLGAYPGTGVGMAMTARTLATGAYDIPHVVYEVRGVVTNTPPVGPFRGAGRPEAIQMIERAMDHLAARLDLDPVEVRRRNLIKPEQFPYVNAMGQEYDSGNYEKALDEALRRADYDGLRQEQKMRRDRGDDLLLGIGVSTYVENAAAFPDFQTEYASVEVDGDGQVTVVAGTSAHGQGHWTTYAQIVSGTMGVPVESIKFVQSDTARVKSGMGTGGSRSVQIGGSAVQRASEQVLEQARELAAWLFEASSADIEMIPGEGLGVRGVPGKVVSWALLAQAIRDDSVRPPQMAPRLFADPGFSQGSGTAPFGAHVVVAEVDRRTGLATVRRVVAVDDCGVVINPLLAEGQVHGGLAAGIGQALFETSSFDETGNPLTVTFADYGMPSAADLPSYDTAHTVTPTDRNPLGAKGLGEAGTTGSLAATHSAVTDALTHLGLGGLDLPLTPLRVWEALQTVE